jgi:hypothetical protein
MPVVSGRLARRAEKASKPPAEAPIPTTGKTLSSVDPDAVEVDPDAAEVEGGEEERLLRFGIERFFTGQTLSSAELKRNTVKH